MKKISLPQDSRYTDIHNHNYARLREKFDKSLSDEQLLMAEIDWEYANNPEYRNLINEYTNGSMLYEVSLDKVWNKAATDNEGLEKYFKKHKVKYKWDEPYAKGILVQAKNDSIATIIKSECASLPKDSIIPYIRNHFQGNALAEKILLPKGKDAMIDNIFFKGEPVKPKVKGFTSYFILNGKLIETPEEMSDVRNQVTQDYQDEIEKEWITKLKKKYKIQVNNKEHAKVKQKFKN